jgi:FMN-dependent NADH-azoreductase
MTHHLLHIVATPRGLASNTGRVSSALIEALHEQHDDLHLTTLDLFSADLPAVAGANIKSKYALMTGQPLDDEARSSWREIEKTIETFLAADLYLLTVPMWNFGIPYALKYYIDAIVQPGYLFRYNERGQPEGLVYGRKMVVVTTSGADYTQPPMDSLNFVEGYLRTIFGFVGITDIHFFTVQPMDITPELRRDAFKTGIRDVRAWVEAGGWRQVDDDEAPEIPAGVKPQVIVEDVPPATT